MSDMDAKPMVPPERPNPLYRAPAMHALESHEDIERLLPVTNVRSWLIALAGLLILAAAVLYAASDSRLLTVSGHGRVADGQGVRLVTSSVAGQLASFEVEEGDDVVAGQIVAYVTSGDQRVPQRTVNAGTVVGGLWRPGDPIRVGDWLMEVASSDSDGRQVLVAFTVEDGQQVREGQDAVVTVTGALNDTAGRIVNGTVLAVTDPVRATEIELGLALLIPPDGPQIVGAVEVDEALEPGSAVDVTVTVSERNLLQQMLGLS